MILNEDTTAIRALLESARRIAVVGISPKPERDSNMVAQYLIAAGYEVIPVNPGQAEVLGRKCYPDLGSIPGPVDIVDVFRSPEHVPGVVEDAIRAGAKAVWLQLGAEHPEAARRASDAGLAVIFDSCIKVAHQILRVAKRP